MLAIVLHHVPAAFGPYGAEQTLGNLATRLFVLFDQRSQIEKSRRRGEDSEHGTEKTEFSNLAHFKVLQFTVKRNERLATFLGFRF